MSKFNEVIDRTNTKSQKYDFNEKHNVPDDVMPLWVADMDFQTPESVREALVETAKHGIFGYSGADENYTNAVLNWMGDQFDYHPDVEELVSTPGVVFAIAHAIRAFTKPGDSILIQEPVYYPFRKEIEANDRNVVSSPLKEQNGGYFIDFDDFEKKILNSNVKLFILCNPHNPVGRVYTEYELNRLAEICRKYNVPIVSDEIHADFIHGNRKHIVLPTLSDEVAEQTILCTSPSKTFNLAGLQVSNIFIKNKEMRRKFQKELQKSGVGGLSIMAYVAAQAAYENGKEWVKELNNYIEDNFEYIDHFLKENIPQIKANIPEGTYLVWLDCKSLGMTDKELKDFFLNDAKLWLDEGTLFGEEGSGYMRLNAAAPRETITKALENLKSAVENLETKE